MTPAGPRDRAGRLVSGDANNANSADEASRAGQGNAGKKKKREMHPKEVAGGGTALDCGGSCCTTCSPVCK